MPEMDDVAEIRLTVNSIANGDLKMNFTNLNSISKYQVFLKDSFLNSITNIKEKPAYDFAVDRANPSTFGASRFKLIFEKIPVSGVKYIAFTGEVVYRGINLKWSTKTEYNNEYFEIERSSDGVFFTRAGKVEGGGISSVRLDYSFLDDKPTPGINYYRLRQHDIKGECIYSNIISVNYIKLAEKSISIYPNPAKNEFNLNLYGFSDQTFQVNIYDARSLKVKAFIYNKNYGAGFIKQDISDLMSGVYVVEVIGLKDKAILQRLKLIKE